jgi:hypothetical protein
MARSYTRHYVHARRQYVHASQYVLVNSTDAEAMFKINSRVKMSYK